MLRRPPKAFRRSTTRHNLHCHTRLVRCRHPRPSAGERALRSRRHRPVAEAVAQQIYMCVLKCCNVSLRFSRRARAVSAPIGVQGLLFVVGAGHVILQLMRSTPTRVRLDESVISGKVRTTELHPTFFQHFLNPHVPSVIWRLSKSDDAMQMRLKIWARLCTFITHAQRGTSLDDTAFGALLGDIAAGVSNRVAASGNCRKKWWTRAESWLRND